MASVRLRRRVRGLSNTTVRNTIRLSSGTGRPPHGGGRSACPPRCPPARAAGRPRQNVLTWCRPRRTSRVAGAPAGAHRPDGRPGPGSQGGDQMRAGVVDRGGRIVRRTVIHTDDVGKVSRALRSTFRSPCLVEARDDQPDVTVPGRVSLPSHQALWPPTVSAHRGSIHAIERITR